MKLHKKLLIMFSVLLVAFTLVACGTTLTKLTLEGISNIEVEFDAEFNVLTNVKAIGDDKKDYTDKIVLKTTSSAIDVNTGVLNTKSTGEHKVRYDVVVGKVEIQEWRTITVKTPPKGEGLLQNGDFSQGDAHWTIDQGQATVTVADGVMEIDVVAGGDAYQPRMHQMGIPFENGKTYEVKYEAKASVEKTINLQVGELLEAAPWFTDFKPKQIETADLTTEWQTFSYKFTHKLDNINGGVLFELGTVNGKKVDGIVYFKNITIAETTAGEDVLAPEFEGVGDVSIQVGDVFNPLAGVSAYDLGDGDVTANITYEITKDGVTVDAIDTADTGEFIIVYTVKDSKNNEATATRTVTVEAWEMEDENLVVNGDFSEGHDNWTLYHDAGGNPTLAVESNKLVIDVDKLGANAWDVQLFQEGIKLEKGASYRISFKASSTVARDFNLALGVALTQDPWFTDYMDKKLGNELTTSEKEYAFIFTVTEETTELGKLVLELGNTTNGAAGKVTIDDIVLQKKKEVALINGDFTVEGTHNGSIFVGGHQVDNSSGEEHATIVRSKETLTVNLASLGAEPFMPHYYYTLPSLAIGTYQFKITITGDVARTLRFNVILPNSGYASIIEGGSKDLNIEKDVAYEFVVDFTVSAPLTIVKIELDFGTIPEEGAINAAGTFVLEKISLEKK